jgi:hypothetical protein
VPGGKPLREGGGTGIASGIAEVSGGVGKTHICVKTWVWVRLP